MNKTKPIVICGFSGIGKSYAAEQFKKVLDLESSIYSKVWSDLEQREERHPEFPGNYVDEIEDYVNDPGEYLYILVSCHEEVRKELRNRGIDYIIATPRLDHRDEYIRRWVTRGSDIKFIRKMYDNWEDMLRSCVEDPMPKIVSEHRRETLRDMLSLEWDERIGLKRSREVMDAWAEVCEELSEGPSEGQCKDVEAHCTAEDEVRPWR